MSDKRICSYRVYELLYWLRIKTSRMLAKNSALHSNHSWVTLGKL